MTVELEQVLWRTGKRNEAMQTALAIRELVAALSQVARWSDEPKVRQVLMQVGTPETAHEGGGLTVDAKPAFSIHLSAPMNNFWVMCFPMDDEKVAFRVFGMAQYSGFELKCELPAKTMLVDVDQRVAEGVTEGAILLARAMHKLPHG